MDNNELDKILKEKLKGKLQPTKEIEEKVKQTIKEQQEKNSKSEEEPTFKKAENEQTSNKSKFGARILKVTSIAAMLVIIFTVGILFNNNVQEDGITTVTIQSIEPTKSEGGILANDSEFLIYTEESATVEQVQKSLYIEPALDYTITKTGNSNEYKLTFKQNIPDNTIVKLQYVQNQITENSWAYQTSNKLSITETFPEAEETNASTKTVIEIEFSYASVKDLEDYVTISPSVDGEWQHIGKVWRFTPSKALSKDTKYTVTVKQGIQAEDQTLENDYKFQFATYGDSSNRYYTESISADGIYTYKSSDSVKIYYDFYADENEISKIEISKFETVDNFIDYLQTRNYEKATLQGDYEFENEEFASGTRLKLKQSLSNGYYVASVQNSSGKELFNCPIQINDLDVYAMETERDVVAWVASDGNLAENISVEYQGKTQKTNNQGIATFEGVTDSSDTLKYMKVGNTDNKLVVGIYNYTTENYPNAYIYTDRPLYKNTDTINIWGFVPRKLFYDDIDDEFYIELNNEGKQKVEVGEDGNLNYKIDLKNHIDYSNASICLYYKDTQIAYRSIEIENYELQNYTYEAVLDKNYAYLGETFEFGVKVTHITGLNVANKTVEVSYCGTLYREKTGEDGIAHFSIKVEKEDDEFDEESSGFKYQYINIYNGDGEEYTDYEEGIELYVLSRNVYTNIEEPESSDDTVYNVTLYKFKENEDIIIANNDEKEIYDGTYDTDVTINLIEHVDTRYISGYEYDEYTKQNEPTYSWDTSSNTTKIKTISTENGSFEFDRSTLELKKDTEDVSYYYELEFVYNDANGNEVRDCSYEFYYENDNVNKLYDTGMGYVYYSFEEGYDYIPNEIAYEYYSVYRYFLKTSAETFSIGDTVNLSLAESTKQGYKDIENAGKILRIVFQEDTSKIDIIEDDNLDYTFTDEDFPGCKIASAYFINGKFYRMPTYYYDFNEEDRKVDIEITADKEQYSPGDEVTLTIKTTNNGNPVKSFVNVSVVNEAVFALGYYSEETLMERIYYNKGYPVYTYSSYFDDELSGGADGGGGGGSDRGDFGDTAYFGTVYTDKNGNATVKFKLPDNVTTYRVTAQSANEDCYLGENTIDITSTLDFFVQVTEPRSVKTTDDLVLNATSIAEESYDVEFEFTIEELNKTLTTTAKTNTVATVNFGKLPAGKYNVIVRGKYGDKTDAIKYEFEIVESAQEVKEKKTVNINSNAEIHPTKNPIVLEIYNKNMEQYLNYIDFIETTVTSRLDTRIAYNLVQDVKDKYYGTESTANSIYMSDYMGENYLKNLESGKEDIVLTALIKYFASMYCEENGLSIVNTKITDETNLFEYYLYAAASNESVLLDLQYLKEAEADLDNYNKLLLTLSFEFLGDFQNAKELYNGIELTSEEKEEYASLIALIDTFINKNNAISEINSLIENNPSDEYLRFAILSFFENNSTEIGKEETVTITSNNLNETITLNGMEIKTYTIYNDDLDTIKFDTSSDDLMVSYYYQTSLEDVEDSNVVKDISISLNGDIEKGNTVTLVVQFDNLEDGEVRIALPNSLRLASNYSDWNYNDWDDDSNQYYLENNRIDYVTFYKTNKCKKIEIPLLVTLDGNYVFENVVTYGNDGVYHISNSLNVTVDK